MSELKLDILQRLLEEREAGEGHALARDQLAVDLRVDEEFRHCGKYAWVIGGWQRAYGMP